MDFSVYIIQDREKSNQTLFDELAGDVGLGSSLINAGADLVSDVAGTELIDIYSDPKIVGDTGIVINGDTISNVSIKKELTKREIYSGGDGKLDTGIKPIKNDVHKTLVTTITVTGSLFAPDLLQNANLSSVKLKNMARVLAWASLSENYGAEKKKSIEDDIDHTGEQVMLKPSIQRNDYTAAGYKDYYLRRVLVTVYSSDDMQFRAVLHDNVYVASYEEKYTDKDGNGSFTLVMQTVTPSIYDVIVEGPTYSWNALSVVDEIDTAASTLSDTLTAGVDTGARIIQTMDKMFGLSGKLSDPVNKIAKIVDVGLNAPSNLLNDGLDVDRMLDNVDDVYDNVKDLQEEIPDLKSAIGDDDSSNKNNTGGDSSSDNNSDNNSGGDSSEDNKKDRAAALSNIIQTIVDDVFNAIDDHNKTQN